MEFIFPITVGIVGMLLGIKIGIENKKCKKKASGNVS